MQHLELQKRDQTHLNTFTIDPPGSLDCDDAFSVVFPEDKPNLAVIYVHIANVAYYFNPITTPPELWHAITSRGTTYYGADGINWPMLPAAYANGICSILPGQPEPTHVITCEFHYNWATKELTFREYYCSQVVSKAKLDYSNADSILAAQGQYASNLTPTMKMQLQILLESAQVIKARYRDFVLTPETQAHWMVRYWMIHVNTVMCRDIYRYNPIPDPSKQETLVKYIKARYQEDIKEKDRDQLAAIINMHTEDPFLMYLGKIAMQKSYYTTNPEENYHYGIGVCVRGYTHLTTDVEYSPMGYTHWTSPIRRLPDLLNHCKLLGIIFPDGELARNLEVSNAAELKQDQIERFISTWNSNTIFQVGSILHGIIINVSKVGVSFYIYELQGRYSIHISKLSSQRLEYNGDALVSSNGGIRFELFDSLSLRISKKFFDVIEIDLANAK
jgi:ribonuclease R